MKKSKFLQLKTKQKLILVLIFYIALRLIRAIWLLVCAIPFLIYLILEVGCDNVAKKHTDLNEAYKEEEDSKQPN
jgi:hypothetical protein